MLLTFLLRLAVPEISIDVEIKMKNDRSEMLWIVEARKLTSALPKMFFA